MNEQKTNCHNFDEKVIGGCNMIVDTKTWEIIMSFQKIIRKCLSCDHFKYKNCQEQQKMKDYFDANP